MPGDCCQAQQHLALLLQATTLPALLLPLAPAQSPAVRLLLQTVLHLHLLAGCSLPPAAGPMALVLAEVRLTPALLLATLRDPPRLHVHRVQPQVQRPGPNRCPVLLEEHVAAPCPTDGQVAAGTLTSWHVHCVCRGGRTESDTTRYTSHPPPVQQEGEFRGQGVVERQQHHGWQWWWTCVPQQRPTVPVRHSRRALRDGDWLGGLRICPTSTARAVRSSSLLQPCHCRICSSCCSIIAVSDASLTTQSPIEHWNTHGAVRQLPTWCCLLVQMKP